MSVSSVAVRYAKVMCELIYSFAPAPAAYTGPSKLDLISLWDYSKLSYHIPLYGFAVSRGPPIRRCTHSKAYFLLRLSVD